MKELRVMFHNEAKTREKIEEVLKEAANSIQEALTVSVLQDIVEPATFESSLRKSTTH